MFLTLLRGKNVRFWVRVSGVWTLTRLVWIRQGGEWKIATERLKTSGTWSP